MAKRIWGIVALVLASLAASPVMAHPGHAEHGFGGGALHPLTGLDHFAAMIAVGLWAAQIGRRATFVLPLAFLGCMSVGALLGRAGFAFPLIETGIATSVLVLGLMIAVAIRLPVALAAGCVGLFALFHGHAHGSEFAGQASWLGYGTGFVLMTALLHGTGIVAYALIKACSSDVVVKFAGGAIAALGLVLFAAL